MSKRSKGDCHESHSSIEGDSQSKKLKFVLTNVNKANDGCPTYKGYRLDTIGGKGSGKISSIDVVDLSSIDPRTFFEKYVSKRKPCVISTPHKILDDNDTNQAPLHTTGESVIAALLSACTESSGSLQDCKVQVEKRNTRDQNFGQNRNKDRQANMTLKEFLSIMLGPENSDVRDLYYLSTQQPDEQVGNKGEISKEKPVENVDLPFNTEPTRFLATNRVVPINFPLVNPNMVLESCNLWMGSSSCCVQKCNGDEKGRCRKTNSGLHHDYHDNFYWLLAGKKHFRLFSPDAYPFMSLFGNNPTLHANGVITYENNYEDEVISDEGGSDSEDEAFVFGKGFDYETDSDTEKFGNDGKDDFDEIFQKVNDDDDDVDSASNHGEHLAHHNEEKFADRRPDNFSKIDLSSSNDTLRQKFPDFCKTFDSSQCEVNLLPGQCLYLPASWFHCVTSYGDDNATKVSPCDMQQSTLTTQTDKTNCVEISIPSSVHIAINYWYHPPDDLDNFEEPYQDLKFWKKHRQTIHQYCATLCNQLHA